MIRLDQPNLKRIENQAQQIEGCISLAQGALKIGGVSQLIKNYAIEQLKTDKSDYYSYSLGMMSLRNKLATHLSTLHGAQIGSDQVAVTHGALNGIAALCLMTLEYGDEVIIPEPTYPAYLNAVAVAKAHAKLVPAYRYLNNAWSFDLELIKESATPKTKMIIIAHPSNPCGVCLTMQEIEALAQWCEERNIYCVFDEAYDNYFFDTPAISSTSLVAAYTHVIRAGSFSKTFGMSGWRIGYVVAHKLLIRNLAAVQDGLIVCPNVIAQYAAHAALDHYDIVKEYSRIVHQNRDLAFNLISPLMEEGLIECAKPQAGFFLFLKTGAHDSLTVAENLLVSAGVAMVPGRDFGPTGKPFLRLCYARDQKTLSEGIARLCEEKSKRELFY